MTQIPVVPAGHHFVLDHNFPIQTVALAWPSPIQVSSLSSVEPDLIENTPDWEILIRLWQRGDVTGFITNDEEILNLATEMVALSRISLKLIVTVAVGHQPVRATGLIMANLESVIGQMGKGRRVFRLRPSQSPVDLDQRLDVLASRVPCTRSQLVSRELHAIRETFPDLP